MPRLTGHVENEDARRRLAELLEARGEWFVREGAFAVGLRRGEWELRAAPGGLLFSYWGEAGARAWRVVAWEQCGGKILLEAVRRMGAERARLELVPRASAAAAAAAAARQAACERLAALAAGCVAGARVECAKLSEGARRGEPGRYARIRLRRGRSLLAATGPVVPLGAEEADAFLASALLWFKRLGGGSGPDAPRGLWLVAPPKLSAAVGERVALLREGWRGMISVFEVDEEEGRLTPAAAPSLGGLLGRPAPRLLRPARVGESELVERVVALAPDAVDAVRVRRGETLRFRGLPFARVRRVAGREHLWFGVGREKERRLLDASNWAGLSKLVSGLAEHRRAGAPDRAHALPRRARSLARIAPAPRHHAPRPRPPARAAPRATTHLTRSRRGPPRRPAGAAPRRSPRRHRTESVGGRRARAARRRLLAPHRGSPPRRPRRAGAPLRRRVDYGRAAARLSRRADAALPPRLRDHRPRHHARRGTLPLRPQRRLACRRARHPPL